MFIWIQNSIKFTKLTLKFQDHNHPKDCSYQIDATFFKIAQQLLFVSDCPDLECLSLEGNFSNFLSDRFFTKVMSTNSLANLRIFDVQGTQVPLTIATANSFLRLPSLQELRVSCWRLSEQVNQNFSSKFG